MGAISGTDASCRAINGSPFKNVIEMVLCGSVVLCGVRMMDNFNVFQLIDMLGMKTGLNVPTSPNLSKAVSILRHNVIAII